jgi:hypothetical protein
MGHSRAFKILLTDEIIGSNHSLTWEELLGMNLVFRQTPISLLKFHTKCLSQRGAEFVFWHSPEGNGKSPPNFNIRQFITAIYSLKLMYFTLP